MTDTAALLGTAHYLKPAGACSTPAAVIILDSETRTIERDGLEIEQLRWWEASCTWRADRRRQGETWRANGADAQAAAEAVNAWASYGKTTWLYGHNVGFDLVTTGLAAALCLLGWELSAKFGIGKQGMWCILHKGRRVSTRGGKPGDRRAGEQRVRWDHTLTIADSGSIWPQRLADLDQYTGTDKPVVNFKNATDAEIEARCRADVDILRALILQLMTWWDAQGLGVWSVTGAGLGWQTYRSTLSLKSVVVDHDPGLIAWERAAVYGGRRDIFRHGQLPAGRYAEIDFEAAYPAIAANVPLPAKMTGPVLDVHRQLALKGEVPAGMLAEVTIDTDTARWPVRHAGRVFYPTGRFRTVLAAPDIQAAADAGALAAVHQGYMYVMTGHLRPWARMVLAWAQGAADAECPALRPAAKHWSRAVIGKFAQRGWRTEPWVGPPVEGWAVEETIGMYDGTRGAITGLAGTWYISWADQRGEHERPAVLAFVEAHVRARLGRLIAGRYGQAVVQCDTDGLMASIHQLTMIAAATGRKWQRGRQVPWTPDDVIAQWTEASWPLVMREKQLHQKVTLHGPQQVILDGYPRCAGLPKGAWQTGEQTWAARLWPGLAWQAAHGPPDGYARPVQPYVVAGPYCAGWALADGTVTPAEAFLDIRGMTGLKLWRLTSWAAAGYVLGPRQAAWAEGYWEGGCSDAATVNTADQGQG